MIGRGGRDGGTEGGRDIGGKEGGRGERDRDSGPNIRKETMIDFCLHVTCYMTTVLVWIILKNYCHNGGGECHSDG